MFIYWDGFEIDGSDTDYDIILPENVQVFEFVDCFLSLPIFDRNIKPSIEWYQNRITHKLTIDELKEKLLSGDYPDITININCLHMELLPKDIQEQLYSISKRREPHEEAFGKVENPCMAPVIQKYYTRGEMTVELRISKPGTNHWVYNDDEVIDGYVNNIDLITSGEKNIQSFQINVGPSFYFEYAMYIIDCLRDSFPGMATCGGLDCSGGWTDGCTYADSIYRYEKVQIPVKHSIKNTLKRLTEYDIVRSYKSYYKNGWKYDFTNGFYLANHEPAAPGKTLEPIPFNEYLELCETALVLDVLPFSAVCDTAVHIKLPKPEEYAESPDVEKKLQAMLPDFSDKNTDWCFTGYFAFTTAHQNPVAEFRVHYSMKAYLMELLRLAESGDIDFIKSVTYRRRQND